MTLEINTAFDVEDKVRFLQKHGTGIVKRINLQKAKSGVYLVDYLVEYENGERRWANEGKLELVEKAAEEPKPEDTEEPKESSEEVNP